MKKIPLTISICCALAMYPRPAAAWGPDGHQRVGAISDKLIETHAQNEVSKILGISLATASVWADCAKGVSVTNGTAKYQDNAKFTECDALDSTDSIFVADMENYVKNNWNNCDQTHNNETCHKQHHYTDISIARDQYDDSFIGATSQDIVKTINAAILVMTDQPNTSGIVISSKREALLLLAHLVGDLHQPLHVGAIYLDKKGRAVDPDHAADFDFTDEIRGGNDLQTDKTGKNNLHKMWDSVAEEPDFDGLVRLADQTPISAAPLTDLARLWASSTMPIARQAYAGLKFKPLDKVGKNYEVKFQKLDEYVAQKNAMQRKQIALAGAHLAELLNRIWP